MKKNTVIIIFGLLGFITYLFTNKQSTKNPLEGKVVSVNAVVSVSDESTGMFQNVVKGNLSFEWSKENEMHRACIGEMAPQTIKTDCQIMDRDLQVIHFIDMNHNKPDSLCLYIDFEKQKCYTGSVDKVYTSESEVSKIRQ